MKVVEKPNLPKDIFDLEVSPQLIAQSVRVYLANQRQGNQSALTRAEVNRTRKKLYKQKGTGGARHGDRKAPIFIGGGISFAPKPRDFSLNFPKKMKDKALFGALSLAVKDSKLEVVSGLDKLTGKTKEFAGFLGEIKKVLVITDEYRENIWRAGRNISGVTVLPLSQINVYEIIKANKILMMEEATEKFKPVAKSKEKIKKEVIKKSVTKKTVKKVTRK